MSEENFDTLYELAYHFCETKKLSVRGMLESRQLVHDIDDLNRHPWHIFTVPAWSWMDVRFVAVYPMPPVHATPGSPCQWGIALFDKTTIRNGPVTEKGVPSVYNHPHSQIGQAARAAMEMILTWTVRDHLDETSRDLLVQWWKDSRPEDLVTLDEDYALRFIEDERDSGLRQIEQRLRGNAPSALLTWSKTRPSEARANPKDA